MTLEKHCFSIVVKYQDQSQSVTVEYIFGLGNDFFSYQSKSDFESLLADATLVPIQCKLTCSYQH